MGKKHVVASIGLLALSGTSVPTSAATPKQLVSNPFQRCEAVNVSRLKQADCACDTALNDGTARVIKMFIEKYAKESPSTACGALALTFTVPGTPPGGKSGNSYG